MTYDEIIRAFNARDAVEASLFGTTWTECYIRSVRWSNPNSRNVGFLEVEVVVLGEPGEAATRYTIGGSELDYRLRAKRPADEALAELKKQHQELGRVYNETQKKLWEVEEQRRKLQAQLDEVKTTAAVQADACEATAEALTLLKKEVTGKANALAEVPVNRLTAEVVTHHIAALRRLT